MSAIHATTAPWLDERSTLETHPRPNLVPVVGAGARRAPRLVYAAIAVAAVVAVMLAQLFLTIAVNQGAYEIDAYRIEQTKLDREGQKLRENLDSVQSPQYLAKNAESLGLVPNTSPVYLRLSDGAVLGQPSAASGDAVASAPLVPNALIDGVPLVTDAAVRATPSGESAAHAASSGVPVAPADPAPPTVTSGLPAPITH